MKHIKYIILLIILILIDQITKIAVMQNMNLYQEIVIVKDFFSLYYIRNDGAAFSLLKGQYWVFYLVTILALIYISLNYHKNKRTLSRVGSVILIAGTIGNFIDRLLYKEVIDFLSFKIFTYDFAIFNGADIFVSCGIGILIIDLIINDSRKKDLHDTISN